jgi:CO/xanthine dehydrogenase Mo-binding subunit
MLTRVAAAVLGLPPERVGVRRGNTGEALTDPGTGGSWVTRIVGRSVHEAASKLKAELEARSGLALTDDTLAAVAARACAGGAIECTGSYAPSRGDDFSFCGSWVDAAVDRETGAVRVTDALLVCDVAEIINPTGHQGQIDGGFAAGIGSALMEEIALDESGKVQTLSLGEYKLPTMRDMPPLRTVLVRARDAQGPFGTKMSGELSNAGVAPAIANAIYDAAGVRLDRFPLTAERVYRALNPD